MHCLMNSKQIHISQKSSHALSLTATALGGGDANMNTLLENRGKRDGITVDKETLKRELLTFSTDLPSGTSKVLSIFSQAVK